MALQIICEDPLVVNEGSTILYTVDMTNHGPNVASGISVLVEVDADLLVVCLSNDWHKVKVSSYLLYDSCSGSLRFQTTNTVGFFALFVHDDPL